MPGKIWICPSLKYFDFLFSVIINAFFWDLTVWVTSPWKNSIPYSHWAFSMCAPVRKPSRYDIWVQRKRVRLQGALRLKEQQVTGGEGQGTLEHAMSDDPLFWSTECYGLSSEITRAFEAPVSSSVGGRSSCVTKCIENCLYTALLSARCQDSPQKNQETKWCNWNVSWLTAIFPHKSHISIVCTYLLQSW